MWAFDGIRTARTLRAAAIPNGDGLPHWPRCDKDAQLIYLDKTVASGPDAARAKFEF
jgi:hypothetical protein